jgi:flagellar hook-associated protein 2
MRGAPHRMWVAPRMRRRGRCADAERTMASPLSLVGLSSGLDTNTVIDRLLAGDRAALAKTQWRQQAVHTQQAHLKDVAAKLTSLLGAVKGLSAGTAYTTTQQVSSADPARVGAVQVSGAGVGGHSIQVDRLAAATQRTYAWAGDLAQDATLELTAATTTTLTFKAGAKLADVVTQINASEASPVYAAAVAGRLVLSSRTSGSTSDFAAAGTLGLAEDVAAARTGERLDALYRLDGDDTPRRAHANDVEDAVPGLRLTLKAITTAPVSVTVTPPALDRDALAGQVKGVAGAYNALVDLVRTYTSEKSLAKPVTASQAAKGTLFGDSGLMALVASTRDALLQGGGLASVGIGVPKPGATLEDAKTGHISVDGDALKTALESDPGQVNRVFKAVAARLEPYVKSQTGGSGAIIDARVTGGDRQAKDIDAQIARANARIDSQQKAYSARFAGMERALGAYQSQQAWLGGMIQRLPDTRV